MDLIKFNGDSKDDLIRGEPINGAKSIVWVERYRGSGEFTIKANLSSGLRDYLPLGSVISHTKTLDAMIVENHEINEEVDSDPEITITGRSFDAFLDNRVVGANQDWTSPPDAIYEIGISEDYTWNQIKLLIANHIDSAYVYQAQDALPFVEVQTDVSGSSVVEERIIKRGSLYDRVQELLAIDDLGLRVIRVNPFGLLGNNTKTTFLIHAGRDKSSSVIFSSKTGDLETVDYLWSDKRLKNAALISGRFVETAIFGMSIGLDKRWMFIDASDLDDYLTEIPTGTDLDILRAKMQIRGYEVLNAQKLITIASAKISSNTSYRYRKDYDIGDIVTVEANYGSIAKMRVIEYVESEDENGASEYPTLSLIEADS